MKKKLVSFMKNHKTEIAIVAGTAIGVTLFIVTKGKASKKANTVPIPNRGIVDIPVPDGFGVGTVKDLWHEGDYLNAIINDLTPEVLGKLGEEFVNNGLVEKDTTVSVIIGFLDK